MNNVVCSVLPKDLLTYLSRSNCQHIDKALLYAGLILIAVLLIKVTPKVVRNWWRNWTRHEWFENQGYATNKVTNDGKIIWTYPKWKWLSLEYGKTKVKRAVLEIKFLANVTQHTLDTKLDTFSIAFKQKFFKVEGDPKDPALFRFMTGKVPDSVNFDDLPNDLPVFTACPGISEKMQPVLLSLRQYAAAAIYSPTRSGKTVCAYSFVYSAIKSTPGLRVVVVSIKNLAMFKQLPECTCLNASRKDHLSQLMVLFREWRESATRINNLIDENNCETIEDLYERNLLDPIKDPRWIWVIDEAPAYLKSKNSDRLETASIEGMQAEIVKMLAEWLNTMGLLSRFALIIGQSGRTDRLPIELDNLGFKIVGRQQNDQMATALIGSNRAARDHLPPGVFLIKDETGEIIKFRVPYQPINQGDET
jgi:hypothetical protein